MKNIEDINKAAIKKILTDKKITDFSPGDTIKVGVKIIEGKRERIQFFEGVDQRLLETRNIEEYSLGDFVLSGGEPASYVFVDAIIRLLPGVLGKKDSIKDESFENHLLEYPQYTKPRKWEGKSPPEVLFSGDHAKIKGWRLSQSEAITRRQRPDLWKKYLEKKNEKY